MSADSTHQTGPVWKDCEKCGKPGILMRDIKRVQTTGWTISGRTVREDWWMCVTCAVAEVMMEKEL